MKFNKVIKEVLFDWKHWFGWIVSAGAIEAFLIYVLDNLIEPGLELTSYSDNWLLYLIMFFAILIPEVIVDLIKHWTELQ